MHNSLTGNSCTTDNNECTNDVCSSNGVCGHNALTGNPCATDGNLCTNDVCSSNTTCMHYQITSCKSGDGCCPSGCTSTNDNNCLECTSQNQATACNDGNECTLDTCSSSTCSNSNIADMTNCSNNLGKCCGGICDTNITNSYFSSECRGGPICSNENLQYVIANNGKNCSGGICSNGLCEEKTDPIEEENASLNPTTYSASKTQLSVGHNKAYSSGDKLQMDVYDQSHTLSIGNINPTSVNVVVSSTPQQAVIFVGETKKFSFTPGWYDLAITLNKIIGSGSSAKANITTMTITEKISENQNNSNSETCIESWECDEWEECSGKKQTRVCTDYNNCNTYEDKPAVEKSCNTSKKSGKIILYILIGVFILGWIIFFVKWKMKKSAPSIQQNNPNPSFPIRV